MEQKKYGAYVTKKNNEIVDFFLTQFAINKTQNGVSIGKACKDIGITNTTYLNFAQKKFSMSMLNVINMLNYFGYTIKIVKKD
jgi:hypothetical protein